MAASHATGATYGTRLGCEVIAHAVPFAYTDTTAFKAFSFPASAAKPVILEVSYAGIVTFDGTTDLINVGTSTTATEIVSAQNIKATGAAGKTIALTQVLGIFTADTTIYLKYTETGTATVGNGYAIFKLYEVNTNAV